MEPSLMPLPAETRQQLAHRLTQWCAARVPGTDRERHQIGYVIQGDDITIVDRRAPLYPELDRAWSAQPLLRLRPDDTTTGRWVVYAWDPARRAWVRSGAVGDDPVALLDEAA